MTANKLNIDIIIELIIEGSTFRQIAEQLNVKLSTLHDFTSKPEHSARVSQALEISAQTYEEKAEQILINAEASAYEMQRARELAQHYRWKAAKRSPKKYGERISTEHSGEISIIEVKPPKFE
ncbi:MAG: hypothetical protein ACM3KI_11060 [Bacillota bacterium]